MFSYIDLTNNLSSLLHYNYIIVATQIVTYNNNVIRVSLMNDSFLNENKQETLTIKTREQEAVDEFGNDDYDFS